MQYNREGEPFLRDDIEEIIKILKRKSKRIVISTNGYLTERIIEVAKKNKDIGIRISIEGLPEVNDKLSGVKNGLNSNKIPYLVLLLHINPLKISLPYGLNRTIDAYRKISINNLEIKLNGKPRDIVNVRIYPLNSQISEVRFWCNSQLIDIKKIKNSDLKIVHFQIVKCSLLNFR